MDECIIYISDPGAPKGRDEGDELDVIKGIEAERCAFPVSDWSQSDRK
jgi:hypothetical protein